MTEMSPLRRRMIEDMTVRNLSPATQRSYVHAVAKFGRFFGCSPDKLDLEGSGANFSKTTTSWNIRNHEAVFRAIP
jgi:hypothetical protein